MSLLICYEVVSFSLLSYFHHNKDQFAPPHGRCNDCCWPLAKEAKILVGSKAK